MRLLLSLFLVLALAGCSSKFKTYDGPEVTALVVFKEERTLRLLHGDRVLKKYQFELGFAPTGDKQIEGDGRTPEGAYLINRKNPRSRWHLSLGISYPNRYDAAQAAALGQSPGGDIFIHGTPERFEGQDDWTWGCIAVTNEEIEEIYAMVKVGTPIFIYP